MKDYSYFSHDSNARSDEKMLPVRAKYGAKGYGIYFMVIELLRQANDYQMLKDYKVIAYELHEEEKEVQDIIENFELFEINEKYFFSRSLKNRMKKKDEISDLRRKIGKKGGVAKAKANAKQSSSNDLALKKRKEEEEEGKENSILYSAVDVLELVDKILKILKITATPENNFRELIGGQIEHFSQTDAVAVAYKLADKVANLQDQEKYFKFTTWLGRELTDQQKQDINPHAKWKNAQSEHSSEPLPDPLTMPID